ncbi:hypothetical protein [Actinopolyspora mortivallis]|uniref:hypothetical protein n=1 Tax=Actinopolyspora mortivallis TaxID=33906 RepID=UPI000524EF28|nr:hypothetical protein [Actinopolyspora mortivallis]
MSGSRKSTAERMLLVMPSHQLVTKAVEAGYRLWTLGDPELVDTAFLPHLREASEKLLLTDFGNETELRRVVARTVREAGITTVVHCTGGASLMSVVEEAWWLGAYPNPPETVRRLCLDGQPPSPAAPHLGVVTFTVDYQHRVVGMTQYRLDRSPRRLVNGYLHPAPLDDEVRQRVEKLVLERLSASRYRSGAAYTEVTLTADGPRLLTCQPRLPPERVPVLMEVAGGFDFEGAFLNALSGRVPHVPPAHQYAELGYLLLPKGVLLGYTGTEIIAVTPWVRRARFPYNVGSRIPHPSEEQARHGYVVVEGDSPELTHARVTQARADLVTDIHRHGEPM